jgi:cytoskeletal protein CcmA (bactofilin family)
MPVIRSGAVLINFLCGAPDRGELWLRARAEGGSARYLVLRFYADSGDVMLKSEKFFIKRDNSAHSGTMQPVVDKSESAAVVTVPATVSGPRVLPVSIASASLVSNGTAANTAANSSINPVTNSKLIVGSNIKLRGVEITDCDTLVVEGRVEATICSRVIQISDRGTFVGNAESDVAEIRGEFDGDLTVRQKLVVHATGRVSGKVRYEKLVIEEGGQLTGDVQLSMASAKGLTVAVDNV